MTKLAERKTILVTWNHQDQQYISAHSDGTKENQAPCRPICRIQSGMELPYAIEPAAVHNANFGVGSGSHSYQHYFLLSKLF